jgi:hypothetical protein
VRLYIDIFQSPVRVDGVLHIPAQPGGPTGIQERYVLERDRGETRCVSAIVLRTLGEDIFRLDFLDRSTLCRREIGRDPFHDFSWSRRAVVVPVRVIRPDQAAFTIELALQGFDGHSCSKSKLHSVKEERNNQLESECFKRPFAKAYVAESIEKYLSISQE